MAFTQITTTNIKENTVVSYAEYAAFTANVLPKISSVQYADDTFTVLDDTAANTSGTARLIINGSGFQSGATVIVGTTSASSTARVSAEQLRANVTALSAASYTLYVQNPDGGTAIRVNGVTFSNTPVWGTAATLDNQAAETAFGVNISANSDSNITYSNTTALPAGTTLNSNGYFYGTITTETETTYTFSVRATDAENQDNTREFSLTVTVGPPAGALYVWGGALSYGLTGDNSINTSKSSPTQLGSSTNWVLSDNIFYHTVLPKSDGTLWSWGYNGSGNLGLNDRIHRSSPTQVGSLNDWSKTSNGIHFTLSLKNNNTLWAWGENTAGRLGLGDFVYRSSPVQVGSSTNWSSISAAGPATLALKSDGTLWAWGNKDYGVLGTSNSPVGDYNSPRQIGSNTDWSLISKGYYHCLAIKTNGTLWSWGQTSSGQLGLNLTINDDKSSPTQVGSDTTWKSIAGNRGYSFAIKTNGTLWAWGLNNQGQLGLNNIINTSSPTQVGNSTDWDSVFSSGQGAGNMAIKTDGTLWAWGVNGNGQLGVNDISNKSSPVQIGSLTGWKGAVNGYSFTLAIR